MNKLLRNSISIFTVASFLVVTPAVLAAQSSPSSPVTNPNTPQKNQTSATITDRLAQYKKDHVITLGEADKIRLKSVCKVGQVKVKALDARIKARNVIRTSAYTEISSQLVKIVPRLKVAGADTTNLVKEQAELQTLITTYNTSLTTYQTDLSDLSDLNCQADPIAFKSALEAARADQLIVHTNALAIRTYVTDTIQVSLKAARADIKITITNTTETQ